MASFTSLLSSIGGSQSAAPAPRQVSSTPRPANTAQPTRKALALQDGAIPVNSNVAAGVKRKVEEQAVPTRTKIARTEVNVPVQPSGQINTSQPRSAPLASGSSTGTYRGTARASGAANTSSVASKPVQKPAVTATSANTAPPAGTNDAAKPKRGFASLMQKAKAASEAAKAVGVSTIKHKPVEKLSKRDRQRMQEEAAKQKARQKASKGGKLVSNDRSRSGTPVDAKSASQKKAPGPSYMGTMRKAVDKQESTYRGTMNKAGSGPSSSRPAIKKTLAQDRYGGYASWDDLDDAEEDDQEDGYDSEGSSDMMDAGFDDMEREERQALQAAKKEDQAALEEEERRRQEKVERKRKLQALSKSAAARKKY